MAKNCVLDYSGAAIIGTTCEAGRAAYNRVLSGLVAQMGFTGPRDVLEEKMGYCWVTSKNPSIDEITKGIGETYHILHNSFKVHLCASFDGADISTKMAKKYRIDPKKISEVIVYIAPIWTAQTVTEITNITAAKISYEYCVAVGLMDGEVWSVQFSEKRIRDPTTLELMRKVRLVPNPWVNS